MKLIKYPIIGLFIVSVVFVATNSFATDSFTQTPLPWSAYIAGLGQQLQDLRKSLYDRGPGAPIEGYSNPSPYSLDIFTASTMISSELRTAQGDYLAEIRDLVIDPSNGRISNVVLDHLQMMGAKDIEIPFSAVLKTGQSIFVHRTPGDVHQFSGEAPYWSEDLDICSKVPEPAGSYRASKLMGSSVKTSKGQELGRIDDLVIDSREGHIAFLVVSSDGMKGKQVVVPFSLLSRGAENAFALNVSREQFATAPAYRLQGDQVDWKSPYGLRPYAEYDFVVVH